MLDDPRISRQHLQMLANRGKYILQDLNSSAGTFVNGIKVKKHSLQPGDVLLIADVELIYGEDKGGPPEVTPPYRPLPAAEPTDDRITPSDFRITTQLRNLNSDSPDKNK